MNKVAFQIGLLALCISFIVFVLQGLPLVEAVAKAFIVFIGVTVVAALLLLGTISIVRADSAREAEHQESHAEPQRTSHHSSTTHTATRAEA